MNDINEVEEIKAKLSEYQRKLKLGVDLIELYGELFNQVNAVFEKHTDDLELGKALRKYWYENDSTIGAKKRGRPKKK